jgi:hypothetical protein
MSKPIRIKNDELLDEFFRKLPGESYDALDKAMTDTAHMILEDAMKNVADRYNRSERGKNGGAYDTGRMQMGFRGVKDEPMRKVVGNNVSYAAHMEYGTGPAIGRPNYKPPDGALTGWSGRKSMEEDMVASVIWTKGTQPRRFLGRAYDKNKRKVPELMAQQLAARLSEIANQQIAVKKR